MVPAVTRCAGHRGDSVCLGGSHVGSPLCSPAHQQGVWGLTPRATGSRMPWATIPWLWECCLEQAQVVCCLSHTCDSCPPQVPRDTPIFGATAPRQGVPAQPKVGALRTHPCSGSARVALPLQGGLFPGPGRGDWECWAGQGSRQQLWRARACPRGRALQPLPCSALSGPCLCTKVAETTYDKLCLLSL